MKNQSLLLDGDYPFFVIYNDEKEKEFWEEDEKHEFSFDGVLSNPFGFKIATVSFDKKYYLQILRDKSKQSFDDNTNYDFKWFGSMYSNKGLLRIQAGGEHNNCFKLQLSPQTKYYFGFVAKFGQNTEDYFDNSQYTLFIWK